MEDLSKNDRNCPNLPGYVLLNAAYDYEVASAPMASATTRSVTLKTGCVWGHIPCTDIALQNPFNDGVYELEISCLLHATNADVEVSLRDWCRHKFVLRLTDRNRKMWLAGMPDEPLNFAYDHIGDADATGQRCYRLRFFRSTIYPVFPLQ